MIEPTAVPIPDITLHLSNRQSRYSHELICREVHPTSLETRSFHTEPSLTIDHQHEFKTIKISSSEDLTVTGFGSFFLILTIKLDYKASK